MRVDLYTKTVLTGILGCLLWLCVALTPIGTPVQAQLAPTQVVLAGYQVGGSLRSLEGGLPVVMVSGHPSAAVQPPPVTAPAAVAAPLVSSPVSSSSRPAAVGGRCQATTKKGSQCSRNAKPGSSFCWQHGG
jgi:hypothetical protein